MPVCTSRMRPLSSVAMFSSALLLMAGLLACGGGGSSVTPSVSYSLNPAVYPQNADIVPNTPSVVGGSATTWGVNPALPAGLSLNATTGVISGNPTLVTPLNTYTVTANLATGSLTVALQITIVPPAPVITLEPASPLKVVVGATPTLVATASGSAPFTFQWRKNGVNITNAIGNRYALPAVLPADDGAKFSVVVTDNYGIAKASSDVLLTLSYGVISSAANLSVARYDHTATKLSDGRVMVVGGKSSASTGDSLNSVELYDPTTNTFSVSSTLKKSRSVHTATLLNDGSVLLAGGIGGDGFPLSTLEWINGAGTVSEELAASGLKIYHHTATLLKDGKVLIVGGHGDNDTDILSSAGLYDPGPKSFTLLANGLNYARYRHTATLLADGTVLIVGGSNMLGTDVAHSAELYNPTTERFTLLSEKLFTSRYDHTATRLPNGTVLIAGGHSDPTCELYDPATGKFTLRGNLNGGRYLHTATPLANGFVLIAGGSVNNQPLNTVELYDPSGGGCVNAATLASAREAHTATRLDNGQVLLIGGSGNAVLSATELYDPSRGRYRISPFHCRAMDLSQTLGFGLSRAVH